MDNIGVKARAIVTLKKYDDNGKLISEDTHLVDLNEKEVEALWHSQQAE